MTKEGLKGRIQGAWKYLGFWGVLVSVFGGGVLLAPIVIVIQKNAEMNPVREVKKEVLAAGVEIQYEPCEGDREYKQTRNGSGQVTSITICTQKSRTQIGEVDYLVRVLSEASEIQRTSQTVQK